MIENLWGLMVQDWDASTARTTPTLRAHVHEIWKQYRGTDVCATMVYSMKDPGFGFRAFTLLSVYLRLTNVIEHCEAYQFAEDTCLVTASNNIFESLKILQNDFTNLAMSMWYMTRDLY